MSRTRLRTMPCAFPSLSQVSARTHSSKSRIEAIFSSPPKAVCILWKSCSPSWALTLTVSGGKQKKATSADAIRLERNAIRIIPCSLSVGFPAYLSWALAAVFQEALVFPLRFRCPKLCPPRFRRLRNPRSRSRRHYPFLHGLESSSLLLQRPTVGHLSCVLL